MLRWSGDTVTSCRREFQGPGILSSEGEKAEERAQSRGDRARLLLEVHRKRTRDNTHNLQEEKLQLEIKSLMRTAEH